MSKASVYFDLERSCSRKDCDEIKQRLNQIPGVLSVGVNKSGRVSVDYDTTGTGPDRLRSRLGECGYSAREDRREPHRM